jgi:hypothetical protein
MEKNVKKIKRRIKMKDNIVKNPRDLIARSYQNIIDENIKKDKAIFKNINFPTGVGKTHQAIKNSLKNIIYEEFGNCVDKLIKNNRKKHIIAVYIAPMNEHVADVLKTKFPDIEKNNIPIYQVSGKKVLGSHKNIKIYKNWVKYFYKASSQQGHYMYKFVNSLEPEQRDKIFKEIKSLNSKFKRINFFNTLDKSGCIDQKDKKDVVITKNMVINKLSELIEKLIRYISDDYTISTEDNQMIEILFPQFLLRNKSGILLFTYDKFIQKHKNFKFNRKKNKYTTSIKYFFEKDFYPNARFYYFLDETEPGYKRFFEIVTKTLRPDNNAFNNLFSAIYRETRWIFSDYTQNREIISYFKNNSQKNNEKFFENLINKGEHQKILPIDGLSNIEKKTIKLFQKHCHSAYYYSVTLDIYKKIEEQCNFIKKNDETFSIDTFLKVISFFKDCKTVIIDRDLYNKVSGDIENIFSYNNAYIYNPEVMETIFANKIQDESMVKLAEAKKKTDDPSLKEILLSIMAINNSIILDLASFLEKENQFEDTQSKSLNSWKQVVKSKNSFEDLFLENDLINNEQCEFVDEKYVYESNKTLFNVKMVNRYTRSSHKQKTKLRRKYKEISIGQTMIYTSPEKLLTTLLDKKNVVCVLSATGGFKNNLVDNYNFEYLENQSRLSGQFEVLQMDDFDLDVCQKVREYRNKIRHIEFTPFDIDKKTICEDKSFYSYYNQYVENFFDEETDSSWEIKKKFKLKELKTFFSYFFLAFERKIHQLGFVVNSKHWLY